MSDGSSVPWRRLGLEMFAIVATETFDRILRGFMRPETFDADRPEALLRFVLVSLNDVVSIENSLLDAYDRALAALATEPPRDSRRQPSAGDTTS